MKKLVLGIISVSFLMLVGCGASVANNRIDSIEEPISTSITEEPISASDNTLTETPIRTSASTLTEVPSNIVKTYEDETHTQIEYGKMSFNIYKFHIVSQTTSDNTVIYECEIDEGETDTLTHITINIREIERVDLPDIKSIVSYMSEISPDYVNMRIYTNVTDDSGILNLYSVTDDEQTKYIVDYKDVSYLVESDYSYLSLDLFENSQSSNLKINNLKVECANSFITNVNEATYYYDDDEYVKKYDIVQGKDGTRYSAELSFNKEEYRNTFTLNNEKGDNLLTLFGDVTSYSEDISIYFLDVNMDGYIDIQFLEEEGTMNNSYALYVWNDSTKNFDKVKLEDIEMLSYIEVYDGYLKNWVKDSGNSGVIQILVWKDMNTLIKESEEPYEAD